MLELLVEKTWDQLMKLLRRQWISGPCFFKEKTEFLNYGEGVRL